MKSHCCFLLRLAPALLWVRWGLGLCFFYFSNFGIKASLPSDDTIPKGFEVKRYESLWKRSPFTLESVIPELQKGFAGDLMLVGTSTVGTNHYVLIANSKNTAERFLVSENLNYKGIALVSIETHEEPTKVTATLKKGEETSIVKFDPAILKNISPPPPRSFVSPATVNPITSMMPQTNAFMSNTENRTSIRPAFERPNPQKFLPRRFPIPGENLEEKNGSGASNEKRVDEAKPVEERRTE